MRFVRAGFPASGEYRADMPAILRIGDSIVMVSDAGERDPASAFLHIYVRDADETHRRAGGCQEADPR